MKKLGKFIKYVIIAAAVAALILTATNFYFTGAYSDRIVGIEEIGEKHFDCVIVLGAGVYSDKTPTPMLKDRLDTAIRIYKEGKTDKILMSGDHGTKFYDEVNVMKSYAVEKGIPPEDVFMDHAGFSTYESMYRAKEIFEIKTAVAVTQKYHLYRAVYDGMKLGIDVYGVPTQKRVYGGEIYYEARETLARFKDMIICVFKPEPKFLGEKIPVSGNGNITND